MQPLEETNKKQFLATLMFRWGAVLNNAKTQ